MGRRKSFAFLDFNSVYSLLTTLFVKPPFSTVAADGGDLSSILRTAICFASQSLATKGVMQIRRIVPNIVTAEPELCREFYAGFLALQLAMDMGWIATNVSPNNPTAQVSVLHRQIESTYCSALQFSDHLMRGSI